MTTKTPEERAKDIFDRSHNPASPHLIDMIAEAIRESEQRGVEKPWPTIGEFEDAYYKWEKSQNEIVLANQPSLPADWAYHYLTQHAAPKAAVSEEYCDSWFSWAQKRDEESLNDAEVSLDGLSYDDVIEWNDKARREGFLKALSTMSITTLSSAALQSHKAQDVSILVLEVIKEQDDAK